MKTSCYVANGPCAGRYHDVENVEELFEKQLRTFIIDRREDGNVEGIGYFVFRFRTRVPKEETRYFLVVDGTSMGEFLDGLVFGHSQYMIPINDRKFTKHHIAATEQFLGSK